MDGLNNINNNNEKLTARSLNQWYDYEFPKQSQLIINWNEENVSKIKLQRQLVTFTFLNFLIKFSVNSPFRSDLNFNYLNVP